MTRLRLDDRTLAGRMAEVFMERPDIGVTAMQAELHERGVAVSLARLGKLERAALRTALKRALNQPKESE